MLASQFSSSLIWAVLYVLLQNCRGDLVTTATTPLTGFWATAPRVYVASTFCDNLWGAHRICTHVSSEWAFLWPQISQYKCLVFQLIDNTNCASGELLKSSVILGGEGGEIRLKGPGVYIGKGINLGNAIPLQHFTSSTIDDCLCFMKAPYVVSLAWLRLIFRTLWALWYSRKS